MSRFVYFHLCVFISTSFADTGYFWHVTDFHWDFTYWTEQLSCNGKNISKPGTFGNQWCDAPWTLVQETIKGIKNTRADVDFILWTGDTVPHISSNNLSTEINKELVRNLTTLMKEEFPDVPVCATFGNHDYHKKHLFPPHNNEIYNATYLIWKSWINDSTQDQYFLKGGYYSALIRSGLRIIAMNSNMYYTKDTETIHLDDPADQFAWLDSLLADVAANNEKAIITGHVPPGFTTPRALRWMTEAFNKKFIDVITRHADVIVAMHFGHEHHDSFRLFNDKDGNSLVSLFLAPSVTPWRYILADGETEPPHNPGARLVKYDQKTGKQLDILQYYADFNKANEVGQISWKLGYEATKLYQITDITAKSMGNVVAEMTSRTNKYFQSYINWYNTNANTTNEFSCDDNCYHRVKCGFSYLDEKSFNDCLSAVNSSVSIYNFLSQTVCLVLLMAVVCNICL